MTNIRYIFRYLLGFALWNVDIAFCSSLRRFRSSLSPGTAAFLGPITQLHGWWHILAGYATYLQILSVAHHR